MPKLKHIALSTQDVDGTAKFYIDVFGMKEIGKIDSPGGRAWSGIHHIGFEVEDIASVAEKLVAAGSRTREDINEALGVRQDQRKYNVEVKYTGPDGVTIDISETGWVGTSQGAS
jgi:catechol 2,3-dioxygenase-like lactoylglutathione lyase family enzyme